MGNIHSSPSVLPGFWRSFDAITWSKRLLISVGSRDSTTTCHIVETTSTIKSSPREPTKPRGGGHWPSYIPGGYLISSTIRLAARQGMAERLSVQPAPLRRSQRHTTFSSEHIHEWYLDECKLCDDLCNSICTGLSGYNIYASISEKCVGTLRTVAALRAGTITESFHSVGKLQIFTPSAPET